MAKRFFYVCAGLLMLATTYHLGMRNAGAASGMASPTEVATLSGVLAHGQTIPLPVYADGTTALESECKWTVSMRHISNQDWEQGSTAPLFTLDCNSDTRNVRCIAYLSNNASVTGQVNYLIIATRGASAPTSSKALSFGRLKAEYR